MKSPKPARGKLLEGQDLPPGTYNVIVLGDYDLTHWLVMVMSGKHKGKQFIMAKPYPLNQAEFYQNAPTTEKIQ